MAETTKQDVEFLGQFEPDVFWQQHGKKIIAAIACVVLIGVVMFYRQRLTAEQEELAATKLAQANDAATLRQLAAEYRGKELAAQALLRLAGAESQAGHPKETGEAYQQFLAEFPHHSLADSAQFGLAALQESQGSFELAKSQYQQLASTRPDSYTAIPARLGAARCAEELGQLKEARQLYEELRPVIRGSPWETEVTLRYMVLNRLPGTSANSTNSTTPPATTTSLLPQP